jgi:rubrerythrin
MSEQNDDRDLAETEELEADQLSPDEEEEAAEHDAQEAPAPAPPDSEATIKRAEKENRRYHKAIDKIFGENSGHRDCPACDGLGITWAQDAEAPELRQADDAEPCPACNAFGVTITGSKNPEQATKPCNECGGRGWRNVVKPLEPVAPITPPAPAADQPIGGQYVPGRGFIPYGATEPLPGTNFGVV